MTAAGSLSGRGAVVTGGGRGIGAAIARALAREGAAVVVVARTAADLDDIVGQLHAEGASAWAARCDVTDEAAVQELGRTARERLGHVDLLVNNAGASAAAPLRKITLEDWNDMLRVNVTSTFLCTREFAPEMVTRGWGRIVNMASFAGLHGGKYIAHYSAAKHAVIGFTRSAALELAGSGVTANAICPGYADTPMTERTLANVVARTGLSRADALAAVLETTQQTRLTRPDEIAAAVVALCGADAAQRNGEAVLLDVGAAQA